MSLGELLRTSRASTHSWPRGTPTERRSNGSHVDAIAVTHSHLDHWGPRALGLAERVWTPGAPQFKCLWVPPRGTNELATFASFWGNPNMFEDAFQLHEFEPEEPFEAAGIA